MCVCDRESYRSKCTVRLTVAEASLSRSHIASETDTVGKGITIGLLYSITELVGGASCIGTHWK